MAEPGRDSEDEEVYERINSQRRVAVVFTPSEARSLEKDTRGYNRVITSQKLEFHEKSKMPKMQKSNASQNAGYKRTQALNGAGNALGAGLKLVDPWDIKEKHARGSEAKLLEAKAEGKLWDHGGVAASADVIGATAGTHCNGLTGGASASATVAGASAKASLIDGVIEANAAASAVKAQAGADYDVLGAKAAASAHVVKAGAGIANTPLNVSASALEANTKVGVSATYMGAEVGASLCEAQAGPFGIRAGVKFGAKIENGIPSVDMGPVSAPCSIM